MFLFGKKKRNLETLIKEIRDLIDINQDLFWLIRHELEVRAANNQTTEEQLNQYTKKLEAATVQRSEQVRKLNGKQAIVHLEVIVKHLKRMSENSLRPQDVEKSNAIIETRRAHARALGVEAKENIDELCAQINELNK